MAWCLTAATIAPASTNGSQSWPMCKVLIELLVHALPDEALAGVEQPSQIRRYTAKVVAMNLLEACEPEANVRT